MAYILALVVGLAFLHADPSNYWQQRVRYKLDITYLEDRKEVVGRMKLSYYNMSPDTLQFLFFHFYPAAFSTSESQYSREAARRGRVEYLLSDVQERSRVSMLEFTVGGAPLKMEFIEPDVIKVFLPYQLMPGDSVQLEGRFRFKLPAVFSRLGVEDDIVVCAYCYPRVAVYDRRGWHLLPYADIGEFYGEYGRYEVSITVPEDYIVLATGKIMSESALRQLHQLDSLTRIRIRQLDSIKVLNRGKWKLIIDSLKEADESFQYQGETSVERKLKTVQFVADNVHDFIWVASGSWWLLTDTINLGDRNVTSVVAFKPWKYSTWKHAPSIIDTTVKLLSSWVGEYAYSAIYAVDAPLKAGAGMEFPMLVVVAHSASRDISLLKTVLVHEVIHQWFMGMLGFQERYYPWMDEGLTSLYEWLVLDNIGAYPDTGSFRNKAGVRLVINRLNNRDISLFWYRVLLGSKLLAVQHALGMYQSPGLPANYFSSDINYAISIYQGVPVYLSALREEVGTDQWDSIMRSFFRDWLFKHPEPSDFASYFPEPHGRWFFNGVLNWDVQVPDYRIIWITPDTIVIGKDTFREVWIKCRGPACPPFHLTALRKDSPVINVSYTGWLWEATTNGLFSVYFPAGDYDRIVINSTTQTNRLPKAEASSKGDVFRFRKFLRQTRSIRFPLLIGVNTKEHTYLAWLPYMSWTLHDGIIIGLAFHNQLLEPSSVEIIGMAGYGLGSSFPVGYLRAGYYFYPRRVLSVKPGSFLPYLRYIWLGFETKRFSYFNYTRIKLRHYYNRFSPALELNFIPADARIPINYRVKVSAHWLERQRVRWVRFIADSFFAKGYDASVTWLYRLDMEVERKSRYNPWMIRFRGETGEGFIKTAFITRGSITYDKYGNLFAARFFVVYFFYYDPLTPPPLDVRLKLNGWTGADDYVFENNYFARFVFEDVIWLRQIYTVEGGFKVIVPFGSSNRWLWTASVEVDLPGRIPAKLYLNFGRYFDDFLNTPSPLLHEFGLTVGWDNLMQLHIPLVVSESIRRDYEQLFFGIDERPTYLQMLLKMMTFTVDLNLVQNLVKYIRDLR